MSSAREGVTEKLVPAPTTGRSFPMGATLVTGRANLRFLLAVSTVSLVVPGLQGTDLTAINTIRTLSMDAVQAANSGHPGTPMAMVPVAYCLWQRSLRFDPQDPAWANRDRFILSIGHASMLLYSLLHLAQVRAISKDYETLGEVFVPLDAIKAFRQLDSRCPGHPVGDATSITVHCQFTAQDGKVLLERDADGKVRLIGDNLKATKDFAKKAATVAQESLSSDSIPPDSGNSGHKP